MMGLSLGKAVNLLFIVSIGVLLAIPTVGLAVNGARGGLGDVLSSAASARDIPRLVDQFIASNFGLREEMVRLDADLRGKLGGESRRVAYGSEGFLFLKDNDVFSQVTGQRLDYEGLKRFVAVADGLRADAEANDRAFVTLIAPNSHTVYRNYLPAWARSQPAVTERDILVKMLAEKGIAVADPTLPLIARAYTDPVYWRGDTHWTRFGMVIGYDETLRALGRPADAVDVDSVFKGAIEVDRLGDLVRIAALGPTWPELAPRPIGPGDFFSQDGLQRTQINTEEGKRIYRVRPAAGVDASKPRVLLIGDSFTVGDFDALFMRFAGEYMWMHHRFGLFDRALIADFDPDIVVFESVERSINAFRSPTGN